MLVDDILAPLLALVLGLTSASRPLWAPGYRGDQHACERLFAIDALEARVSPRRIAASSIPAPPRISEGELVAGMTHVQLLPLFWCFL